MFCKTNNIPFNKNYWKLGKINANSEITFKIRGGSLWVAFEFLLTSAILNEVDQGHFRKLLESSASYISMENTETTRLFF